MQMERKRRALGAWSVGALHDSTVYRSKHSPIQWHSQSYEGGMFESDDELESFRRDVAELVEILNRDSETLRARGFDVDGAIAELEGKLADLENARAEEEEALENYLQVCADLADTRTTCFKVLCTVMDPFADENPRHPLAEEWQQWRPILVQQVPKE
jgi:hypothetical protein